MLKNKKAVYILIPLNLFIWGFFAYRFYSAYSESDLPVLKTEQEVARHPILKDSILYTLKMDYKDPFLKDVRPERSMQWRGPNNIDQEQAKNQKVIKEKVVEPPKQLPNIKFLGLIKNNSSGLSTALVSVNGQSKLIKQNENVDGIVFKTINKDSLIAKWGKERIVVRK